MFRLQRAIIPSGLLQSTGNLLSVEFTATPKDPGPLMSGGTDYPAPAGLREENDAWGWDWSPDLDPISIWKGPVRIVFAEKGVPHLVSWSPKITVLETDRETQRPTSFLVNASFELLLQPGKIARKGSIRLVGDWGDSATTSVQVDTTATKSEESRGRPELVSSMVCASIKAKVPDVQLWWPLHYGESHLHNLTAEVRVPRLVCLLRLCVVGLPSS